MCDVYRADTLSIRVAQQWFNRFCSGVVMVEDELRSNRTIVVDVDKIMEIIQVDRHVSNYSIALKIDLKIVWNHLQKIGYKKSWMFGCHTN